MSHAIKRQVQRGADLGRAVVKREIERPVDVAACPHLLRCLQVEDRFELIGGELDLPPLIGHIAPLVHQIKPQHEGRHHGIVGTDFDRHEPDTEAIQNRATRFQQLIGLTQCLLQGLCRLLGCRPPEQLIQFLHQPLCLLAQSGCTGDQGGQLFEPAGGEHFGQLTIQFTGQRLDSLDLHLSFNEAFGNASREVIQLLIKQFGQRFNKIASPLNDDRRIGRLIG